MLIWPVWILAGGAFIALALNAAASAREGHMGTSPLVMSATLVGTMLLGWVALLAPADVQPYAFVMIDTLGGTVAYLLFERGLAVGRSSRWLLAIVALFALQLCAHVAFQFPTAPDVRIYRAQLNVLFGLQVLVAGFDGLRYVARTLLDSLSGLPRRLDGQGLI